MSDSVNVAACRKSRADIHELPDPGFPGEEIDYPAEKSPVIPSGDCGVRNHCQHSLGSNPVNLIIIFPAQQKIINTCNIRCPRTVLFGHGVSFGTKLERFGISDCA